jgi:hypothetical protein
MHTKIVFGAFLIISHLIHKTTHKVYPMTTPTNRYLRAKHDMVADDDP